mgnify:CR=1 FL=1
MLVKFRDLLAVVVQGEIVAFWILQGLGILKNIPSEINGALIAVFTLIMQFYFRKKPRGEVVETGEGSQPT